MAAEGWSSQTDEFAQSTAAPGEVNFGLGQPSRSLLPLQLMREAAAHRFADGGDPLMLQYGAPRGYAAFLGSLGRFLGAEQGHPVPPEELFLTNGNSGGLVYVCSTLFPRGGVVWVEEATYFLAKGMFADAKLRVRGMPCDADGLRTDAVEAAIAADGPPDLMYVIPTYQNPTGTVLPPQRREHLADLAAAHRFTVISDEPYNMLCFEPPRPPPSLAAYDRGRGRIVSLGTFSKILAPGLRLGWAQAAPSVVATLAASGVVRSGGCLNPVVAGIVHSAIDLGLLARHLAALRAGLRARLAALCTALRDELPNVRFVRPRGGYFVWCRLPEGGDAEGLLARCAARGAGVAWFPGARSEAPGGPSWARWLRLSFAFYTPDELREGVRRLRAALDEWAAGAPAGASRL